ncbi:MAG: spermidine synthase [Myxococcales bacterium]|nr:spermidine synthase [Myxococcales bacterium]
MIPWTVLDRVATPEGELQLRQRGAREFLITIAGRVLMTSSERTSEEALARLACEPLARRKAPAVLIGGLGMAYTVRAALDALPATASVTVAELTPQVLTWCRGPLAPLTAGAVIDRRVRAVISDVADVIARARPGQYHAIILDLYEGPHAAAQRPHDPLYGREALARAHAALAPGGVLTVWTEESNLAFKRRMLETGFATRVQHPGGSRAYAVYVGQKAEAEGTEKAGAGRRPTSQGAGPRRQGSPPRTGRARR